MKEQIDILVKLQHVDTETERISGTLNQAPVKRRLLDERLAAAHEKVEHDIRRVEEMRKRYRSLEQEIKTSDVARKKSNSRLVTLKTNKEYHATLKEIEDIEKKIDLIENEMLALLDEIDSAEKGLVHKKNALALVKKQVETEREAIQDESTDAEKCLEHLKSERERVAQTLSKDVLLVMENVRKRVKGPSVVPVRASVCYGCNMNIPPQMYNELQRVDSLKFCPFCNRIIYWDREKLE